MSKLAINISGKIYLIEIQSKPEEIYMLHSDSLLSIELEYVQLQMITRKIFQRIEKDLREFIDMVPYADHHLEVYSPFCRDIINRSCNEFDSLCHDILLTRWFKEADWKKGCFVQLKKPNIYTYLFFLNQLIDLKRIEVHFFTWDGMTQINPFLEGIEKRPHWWNAHNKLKHERVRNINLATYRNAIDSVLASQITMNILLNGIIYNWKRGDKNEIVEGYDYYKV